MPRARIVFDHASQRHPGATNVFTSAPDGSRVRELTYSGRDADAAWSPDGRRILFARNTRGSYRDIWLMDADGRHKRRVVAGRTDDFDPAWAPDGRHFVFSRDIDYDTRVLVGSVRSRHVRQLTGRGPDASRWRESGATWSPDGRWITYAVWEFVPELSTLWATRPDGSDTHEVLSRRNRGVVSAAWAPRGHRIAVDTWVFGDRESYECGSGLLIVRPNGKKIRSILDEDPRGCTQTPSWSPDGHRLVVSDSGRRAGDGDYPQDGLWIVSDSGKRIRYLFAGRNPGWRQ